MPDPQNPTESTPDEEGIEAQGQLPYTPNMPAALKPEQEWTRFAEHCLRGLYPRLMPGYDYVWGRPADDPEAEPSLLAWNDKAGEKPDIGKIKEAAQRMVDAAAPKEIPLAQQPISEQSEANQMQRDAGPPPEETTPPPEPSPAPEYPEAEEQPQQ